MEFEVIAAHIRRLIKEPLVWVGAVVLCVPMLGSGTLKSLRNTLMMDSGRVKSVELASASTESDGLPTAEPKREFRDDLLTPEYQASDDGPGSSFDEPLPEASTPVSLPAATPPSYASSTPEPYREPGSLFEAASEAGVDPIDDSAFDENAMNLAQQSQPSPNVADDEDFDFLFGDEAEDVPSQMSNDDKAKPPGKSDNYAGDNRKPPSQKPKPWLFPDDDGSEESDLLQPPAMDESGSLAESNPFSPPEIPRDSVPPEPFEPGVWSYHSNGSAMGATQYPPLNSSATATMGAQLPAAGQVYAAGNSACNSGACPTPVYQSVVTPEVSSAASYTFAMTGLFFQRDYEDNRRLAFNPAGDQLSTNDADEHTFDGYGLTLARRSCSGNGLELAYWALNPGVASSEISGSNVVTAIAGLDQLTHAPTAENLYDIYSYSLTQRITRDTDINNLELNFLRNGGTYCSPRNRQGSYELLAGLRWFDFDEELRYSSFTDTATYPTIPSEFLYRLRARNTLIGLQGGIRNELHFGSKIRFFNQVYGGVYNNNVSTSQSITDLNGIIPLVNASGNQFSYNNKKNDVAFLGQLDFGILWQLTCNSRIRFGYRVLGVSGVALAAEQLPFQYDADGLSRVQSNGNLLLNGGYYGLEFAF